MSNNSNKLREMLAVFAVWLDEKIEFLKANKKISIIIGSIVLAILIVFVSDMFKSNDKEETPKDNIPVEENISKGYTVLNKEMYQKGVNYYYNNVRKENELWQLQASVPFYFNGTIQETATENNISVTDSADYFYGAIVSIKDETEENLRQLEDQNVDSQVIEYEKKILDFVENVVENYSADYTVSKSDEEEYLSWIDGKCAILNVTTNESNEENETSSKSDTEDYSYGNVYLNIEHGEFVEAIENGDILVVKAKISPSYSNKATINQNNFNVEDIVKNQVGNKYNEIQYWAVSDMQDGSESKVVSFTIGKDVINAIINGSIPGNTIMDYATDVWILPSLLK